MFQVLSENLGDLPSLKERLIFALYERILQENIKPSVLSRASGSDSKTMNPRMQAYLQESR